MTSQDLVQPRRLLFKRIALCAMPTAMIATSTDSLAAARQITVGAATSIADFVRALAIQFEKISPGVEVRVTAGASDIVASQAIRGAPMEIGRAHV